MIPHDFIQTLLARIDIVGVIEHYLPLKKTGANYAACCPFHNEKTPSFTVSPTKQFYHCFGCGAHGTAIGFLIDYAGKSFPDAVEDLARGAGLEVPRIEREGATERREQTRDLTEVMRDAAKFYRARLKDSTRAVEYLKGRGLTGTIAAHFGIGYAPDAWQPLASAFDRYEDPALEAAGLVVTGDGGKRYDRFRDRIMFPIHDVHGQVIAFGGRVLGDSQPKYLNSPETPIFSKGRELYGLLQARNAIRDAAKVVVVEGYMDVVALAQHGIEYVVATLGTATTSTHVQKLFRLTDTVVFCFDGDAAGRKAAWRALENVLPALADGKNVQFLLLPEGQDPDDYIRAHGQSAFEALVANATPLSEFMLGELAGAHSPTHAESRAALVAAARPLLSQLRAPVLLALLRRQLADITGVHEMELRGLLHSADLSKPAAARNAGAQPPRAAPPSPRRPPSLVRELMQALLLQPEAARSINIPQPEDGTPEADALCALAQFCMTSSGPLTTPGTIQHFAGTVHERLLAAALATAHDHAVTPEQAEEHLRAGVQRYWLQAQRNGHPVPATPHGEAEAAVSTEETERLRQLELVRRAFPDAPVNSSTAS